MCHAAGHPSRLTYVSAVWPELVKQRLDVTKVNKRWLDRHKKEQGLK